MSTDPFLELRRTDDAVDPDPDFRSDLRDRIRAALANPEGEPVTDTYTPPRLHTMTPYLCCADAREAIEWYRDAFGAELIGEIFPMGPGDDRVGHAEMQIGDSVFMLSDEWPEGDVYSPTSRGGASVAFVLYVPDVDATYSHAVERGATAQRAVEDQHHGSRVGWLKDPYGHRWSISTALGAGDPYGDAAPS